MFIDSHSHRSVGINRQTKKCYGFLRMREVRESTSFLRSYHVCVHITVYCWLCSFVLMTSHVEEKFLKK